ncbi:hypothetical protein EON62_00455 [archaeon]|nr:MAG: hypothetical protein EON62_00455 [archaeon]
MQTADVLRLAVADARQRFVASAAAGDDAPSVDNDGDEEDEGDAASAGGEEMDVINDLAKPLGTETTAAVTNSTVSSSAEMEALPVQAMPALTSSTRKPSAAVSDARTKNVGTAVKSQGSTSAASPRDESSASPHRARLLLLPSLSLRTTQAAGAPGAAWAAEAALQSGTVSDAVQRLLPANAEDLEELTGDSSCEGPAADAVPFLPPPAAPVPARASPQLQGAGIAATPLPARTTATRGTARASGARGGGVKHARVVGAPVTALPPATATETMVAATPLDAVLTRPELSTPQPPAVIDPPAGNITPGTPLSVRVEAGATARRPASGKRPPRAVPTTLAVASPPPSDTKRTSPMVVHLDEGE